MPLSYASDEYTTISGVLFLKHPLLISTQFLSLLLQLLQSVGGRRKFGLAFDVQFTIVVVCVVGVLWIGVVK